MSYRFINVGDTFDTIRSFASKTLQSRFLRILQTTHPQDIFSAYWQQTK